MSKMVVYYTDVLGGSDSRTHIEKDIGWIYQILQFEVGQYRRIMVKSVR